MLNIKRLSNDEAKLMNAAAEKNSAKIGIPMCSAVTDDSGNLIEFSRMGAGKVSCISIAIDKAFTAAAAKNAPSFYSDMCQPGSPAQDIEVSQAGLDALEAHWKPAKSSKKRKK